MRHRSRGAIGVIGLLLAALLPANGGFRPKWRPGDEGVSPTLTNIKNANVVHVG
jgi:hypothetical protein